jgi:hypothetical protein
MYSTGTCWWSSSLDDRNMREMTRSITRCTALSANARLVRSRCMHPSQRDLHARLVRSRMILSDGVAARTG